MPTSKIGLHDLDPSLFETLSNISGSNSQTKIFPLQVVASEDNQTVFPIGLDTFDAEKDFAFVQSGITNLFYGADFTIENKNIILKEGVPAGRTLGIYVLKNVAQTDEEDYVSGANLAPGSVTPDKIGGVLPIEKGGTGAGSAEEAIKAINGMQHKKINDTKDFTTVLEAVNACDNGGTFFAVVNTNLINASDSPSPGTEFHYLVLSDDQSRKRVIAFGYGGGEKTGFSIMYTRWAFQGQWRQNEWTKMTEEFLSTNGGILSGDLKVVSGHGEYQANNEAAIIGAVQTIGSTVGRRWLGLWNESRETQYALMFGESNGAAYNIFGEHNTDLLATHIQNIIQGGNVSMVRHIQRGIVAINSSNGTEGVSVILSGFTNAEKMSVKLFGSTCYTSGSSASGADSVTAYIDNLTSTELIVKVPRASSGSISYEVIEFY